MAKRKKWYEVHHERCMAFRTQAGVKEGDGFKRLAEMKQGTELQRALAETYEKIARDAFMSADFFDALIAAYGKVQDKCRSLEPTDVRSATTSGN